MTSTHYDDEAPPAWAQAMLEMLGRLLAILGENAPEPELGTRSRNMNQPAAGKPREERAVGFAALARDHEAREVAERRCAAYFVRPRNESLLSYVQRDQRVGLAMNGGL